MSRTRQQMAQLQRMMNQAANANSARNRGGGNDIPLVKGVNAANQIIQSGRDLRRDKMMHGDHTVGARNNKGGVGVGVGIQDNGFNAIGANENGVFGMSPESKYTFNEEDYIPSEQNGYHLGNYQKTEMYGHPEDFKRQMVANETGYGLGAFEPTQTKWFLPNDNTNPLFMSGLDIVSGSPAETSLNSILGGLFNSGSDSGVGIGDGLGFGDFEWLKGLF